MNNPPHYFRTATVREKPQKVDEEKRTIEGYAVITAGEALGHGLWIDETFLQQVVEAGEAAGSRGVKNRFKHPGISSDGTGSYLGRSRRFRRDGMFVRADMSISPMADKSPDGELGTYVLGMAKHESDMFGASIVFQRDRKSEQEFQQANAEEWEDEGGELRARFRSPDPSNTKNLPHARLAALHAADVVDDPAANPGGFLSRREELAVEAEKHLAYAMGLSDECPEGTAFGVDPDRARGFFARFLENKGLVVQPSDPAQIGAVTAFASQETDMAEKNETTTPQTPVAEKPKAATLAELKAAFVGDENAAFRERCLEKELTLPEARLAFTEKERDEALAQAQALADQIRDQKIVADAGRKGGESVEENIPGRIEVGESNAAAFTLANPLANRILTQFSGQVQDALKVRGIETGSREDFANESIRAYNDARDAGSFDERHVEKMAREMLYKTKRAVELGQAVARPNSGTSFAMGKSGPDYSLIVVKGIIGSYYKTVEESLDASWVPEVMWLNPDSNQETETYRWLGQTPMMKVWSGGRQTRGLPINAKQITNETYEATLRVDIEDFRFDKTGQLAVRLAELGAKAAQHWEKLLTTEITADNLCYDGENFYDTDHPAADGSTTNTATYKNELTNGEVGALDVSSTSAVTRDEMADIIIGLTQYQFSFLDGEGDPFNGAARRFGVMVPTTMLGSTVGAIFDRLTNSGSSGTLATSLKRFKGFEWLPMPNPRLDATSTTVLYLHRLDTMQKPYIGQQPVPPELSFLGEGSDTAFKENAYLIGVKSVRAVGNGQWAHSLKATVS